MKDSYDPLDGLGERVEACLADADNAGDREERRLYLQSALLEIDRALRALYPDPEPLVVTNSAAGRIFFQR